ncbi:PucR family transcriptional regulator [Streptomyces sp. CA-249302]|uniref:PucR family transcriptional regulator n=1 Tax=Streptomyces sp. CA-249302 TaxID=3240058 RepID=UPI003D8CCEC1
MHVEHLLGDESLGLRLLWAEDALLRREISGVTVTDLEDPARFVRPGEAVLSGLVWWNPEGGRGRAERFVGALKDAGAAVLLAGEETHGVVPDDLIEACVRHGVPVAGVPATVMFRAITDTVYLRQWGELSRHHALPEIVRGSLTRLLARDAGPGAILAAAFAHLDRPDAYVLTPSGRTVAATEGAPVLPVGPAAALVEAGAVPVDAEAVSPYERWHLHLADPDAVPPRMLHEIAAILGRCQDSRTRQRATAQQAADELGALLAHAGAERAEVEAALRACGMPAEGTYGVVVADAGTPQGGLAEGALAEAVAHGPGPSAVGRLPDGLAFAVVPVADTAALAEIWPLVTSCEPSVPVHGGIGARVGSRGAARARGASAGGLNSALAEARYALASARTTTPHTSALGDASALNGLETLLTGIPAEVRAAYSHTVLGPLLQPRTPSTTVLLETLETFLAHDGSWARTAEALHLHVNTVHYRVGRIEHFTGRDLSSLRDRLDLWAALLCRTETATPAGHP